MLASIAERRRGQPGVNQGSTCSALPCVAAAPLLRRGMQAQISHGWSEACGWMSLPRGDYSAVAAAAMP
jgi:hypothetical protein